LKGNKIKNFKEERNSNQKIAERTEEFNTAKMSAPLNYEINYSNPKIVFVSGNGKIT